MIERRILAAALAMALAAPADAQTSAGQTAAGQAAAGQIAAGPAAGGSVAVLVRVPLPVGMPRGPVVAEMERSVPAYQQLPGLVRKYFTLGDDGSYGGVYLWESRAAAQAFYGEGWQARVRARGHGDARVEYFDVPIAIDGRRPQTASR